MKSYYKNYKFWRIGALRAHAACYAVRIGVYLRAQCADVWTSVNGHNLNQGARSEILYGVVAGRQEHVGAGYKKPGAVYDVIVLKVD